MKNVLKINEYPEEVWRLLVDDYEVIEQEHRRGANFYTNAVIHIDEELVKEFPILAPYPELIGSFLTNTFIWDSDYGNEWNDIDTLTRAEERKVERVITETKWIPVK